jgi:uncharacterized cupin superfamily protein
MEKTDVTEATRYLGTASTVRSLTEALDTSDVAINYHELAPGDALSTGLHTHLDQEEVFYVVSGAVTFEKAHDRVTLARDEAIRFAPGEYQHGFNGGDRPAVVLAIGAPAGSEDVRVECPDCGDRSTPEGEKIDDDHVVIRCGTCDAVIARLT